MIQKYMNRFIKALESVCLINIKVGNYIDTTIHMNRFIKALDSVCLINIKVGNYIDTTIHESLHKGSRLCLPYQH